MPDLTVELPEQVGVRFSVAAARFKVAPQLADRVISWDSSGDLCFPGGLMRPRLPAALLFLSVLAMPAFFASAAPARPQTFGIDALALTGVPLALPSTSLGGAIEQSAGAPAAPHGGTAAAALAALERQQQLTLSDPGVDQGFGFSIAISRRTAVVGAPGRNVDEHLSQGAAYVFRRSGATWTLIQELIASDGAAGDQFGIAVAMAGDTLLIGASQPGTAGPGAAYVFTRSGATWTETQKLTARDCTDNSLFGWALALDGNTAVVGAQAQPYDWAADAPGHGAAYVFTRSRAGWSLQQKLADGIGGGGAWGLFGYALALDGDTLLVSEPGRAVGENARQGAVHVYARWGARWIRQQQLVQSDGEAGDFFGGMTIGLEGETALLGAHGHKVGDTADQGAVYVFTREDLTWSQQQELTSSDGGAGSLFGYTIALDGGRALIGAPLSSSGPDAPQGAAYVFTRSGAVWAQVGEALRARDGAAGDWFGLAVALSGDTALVGAWNKAIDGVAGAGAAYVFGLPGTIGPPADGLHGKVGPGGAPPSEGP